MFEQTKIFPTAEATAGACADYLIYRMDKVLANQNFFHLAISGGSTPLLLFRLLAEKYKSHYGWKRTRIFWVDERCVPADDPESNYGVADKELISKLFIKPQVFPVIGNNAPEQEAHRYTGVLKQFVPEKNNAPFFDLILLGMGEDGHTASLFPGQFEGFSEEHNCIVARHPVSGQKRISLTARVIREAAEAIFMVTGANKARLLQLARDREPTVLILPAFRVAGMTTAPAWYLDSGAAGN